MCVKFGSVRVTEPGQHAGIIDRILHEAPFYRAYLKTAVLTGPVAG